jgi:signal peptidase I
MVPTLQIGDHILVSKFNYGFVFPFTSWEFVGWASPKRGDVIVFIYPKDPSLHYIKRVVGVPGDKVEFRGKELWVNGEAVPKEFQGEGLEGDKLLYQEALAGVSHLVQYSKNTAYDFSRSQDVHEVPADHFFVMGDNRDDSYDSRSWGDVPRANIRGKAQFILLSLDRNANWGTKDKMRWSRAFTAIH